MTIRTKMLDAMQDACLLILLGAAQEIWARSLYVFLDVETAQ